MPTENLSSNTEMVSDMLPCPFCGEKPQITKHHREDIYSFMHRCPVLGPISWGFREDPQAHVEKWNARAQPVDQRHGEPVERDERALPGWLTVDTERVTVRLSRPSEANGVQVDSLSLRAPTVRDICNATVGGGGNDAQSELNLFASLAEVGVKDLEGLALKDYSRLQTGYFHLVQDDYRAALERKP